VIHKCIILLEGKIVFGCVAWWYRLLIQPETPFIPLGK
jgi:hypothetical protein